MDISELKNSILLEIIQALTYLEKSTNKELLGDVDLLNWKIEKATGHLEKIKKLVIIKNEK